MSRLHWNFPNITIKTGTHLNSTRASQKPGLTPPSYGRKSHSSNQEQAKRPPLELSFRAKKNRIGHGVQGYGVPVQSITFGLP